MMGWPAACRGRLIRLQGDVEAPTKKVHQDFPLRFGQAADSAFERRNPVDRDPGCQREVTLGQPEEASDACVFRHALMFAVGGGEVCTDRRGKRVQIKEWASEDSVQWRRSSDETFPAGDGFATPSTGRRTEKQIPSHLSEGDQSASHQRSKDISRRKSSCRSK